MNALVHVKQFPGAQSAPEVTRAPPPLVVELAAHRYAWVQNGQGWRWSLITGWQPLDTAEGLGGRVLRPNEVLLLVAEIGSPE